MATLKMSEPWRDPRTGIFYLRKRIPQRYRAVAGRQGETIKITTGTAERREAIRRWPDVLHRWADMEAEWDRLLNEVALTPDRAQEVAAKWAAWIAAGAALETGGEDAIVFRPMVHPEDRTPEKTARMWDRVEFHAEEALQVSGISLALDTRPLLLEAMLPVVSCAYSEAWLKANHPGLAEAMSPVAMVRAVLPAAPDTPPLKRPNAPPPVSFGDIFMAWKAVAVVKPRTVEETRYILDLLKEFAGHDDPARLTRDDMARWRDALKAYGLTNNTWNNRLSLVRQVLVPSRVWWEIGVA